MGFSYAKSILFTNLCSMLKKLHRKRTALKYSLPILKHIYTHMHLCIQLVFTAMEYINKGLIYYNICLFKRCKRVESMHARSKDKVRCAHCAQRYGNTYREWAKKNNGSTH